MGNLTELLLQLQTLLALISDFNTHRIRLTLHGLFNSNPGGAMALPVWPRRKPVNRLSRSITVRGQPISLFGFCHPLQLLYRIQDLRGSYFAKRLLVLLSSMEGVWGKTYAIPLIDGMSSTLSTVLHRSDLRQSSTGNAEHLYRIVSIQTAGRLRV